MICPLICTAHWHAQFQSNRLAVEGTCLSADQRSLANADAAAHAEANVKANAV